MEVSVGACFTAPFEDIKTHNAKTRPGELQRIVDGAAREARAKRRHRAKAEKA